MFARNGVELHYEVYGKGEPVVLLHGFTSRGSSWERHGWVDLLVGHDFQAVATDVRSHGQSTRVYDPSACKTSTLAEDILGLLDHLRLPSASVFGFSMGSGIAVELAFMSPERVRKLVIAGSGDAGINELHDPVPVDAIAKEFENPSREPADGNMAARIRRNAEAAGNDLRALLPFLQNGGWPAGLHCTKRLSMPSLVIVADTDEYMPTADAFLAALEPSEIVVLHGMGHHDVLPNYDVKQKVVAFLRAPTP
jgi:pimeloyl-ACP methyl ester carboxylesterase